MKYDKGICQGGSGSREQGEGTVYGVGVDTHAFLTPPTNAKCVYVCLVGVCVCEYARSYVTCPLLPVPLAPSPASNGAHVNCIHVYVCVLVCVCACVSAE